MLKTLLIAEKERLAKIKALRKDCKKEKTEAMAESQTMRVYRSTSLSRGINSRKGISFSTRILKYQVTDPSILKLHQE